MNLEITNPIHKGWSVYTRSCCKDCNKVKRLLNVFDLKYNIIDCDYCLIVPEIKEEFNKFLNNLCGCEPKEFPLVFKDMEYIGGYKETLNYLKNKNIN